MPSLVQKGMTALHTKTPLEEGIHLLNTNHCNGLTKVPARTTGSSYNCWGFVATMLGWNEVLDWVSLEEMEDYLYKNSHQVDKPQPGDIVVMRWPGGDDDFEGYEFGTAELMHTALITKIEGDKMFVMQKRGPSYLDVVCTDDIWEGYGKITEYRRNNPPAM